MTKNYETLETDSLIERIYKHKHKWIIESKMWMLTVLVIEWM